jgi:hypothetical protein
MKCEISDHLSILTLLRARNINVKSKNGKNLIEAEIPLKSWMSFRKQSHESNVVMDINVIEFGYYDEVPEYLYESIIQESNLEGANYTDLFSWEKWGKVNEKRYLHDFVESFWEEES